MRRLIPQPLTAIVFCTLALTTLGAGALLYPELFLYHMSATELFVAPMLGLAMIFAGLHPIHIRHNIKVVLTTAPNYAAALLLPPLIGGCTAAIAVVITEILTHKERGNTPSDIATAAGRWALIVALCGVAAHQALAAGIPATLMFVGVGVLMFTGDSFSAAFEIAPMSGESPLRLAPILFREGALTEGVQYLLGLLAILAAEQQIWSLLLWVVPVAIVRRAFKYAREMQDGTALLLESMADAVDLRDAYTGGHSRRVTDYSLAILRQLGISGPEVELIRSAARVHDIGKIGIPDSILNKPGRLSDEETLVMNSHPARGAELLARYRDFARGVAIVRGHHERWDGLGYPDGLRGMEIPFGARVIAVADSFDAMTSDRPYRNGMPRERALAILREGRGAQWDPAIVDALLREFATEAAAEPAIAPTTTAAPA
jgi:hypothetical protein